MALAHSPPNKARATKVSEVNTQHSDDDVIDRETELQLEWARLKEEQRKLEEMRAEFEATRNAVPPAGNTRGKTIRRGTTKEQGDSEDRVVSGVINHLQYLQLDVKPPKFSDENSSNPNEFLTELEKYFNFKNVKEEHEVILTESLLEGRAKIWANSGTQSFRTYRIFRAAFLNEFYSIPIRVKLKNQWLSRRYRHADGNMQEYFYKQLRSARHSEPELTAYEIIFSIVQQFPSHIRHALACVEYDTESVAQALARLDGVQKERESEKRFNGWEQSRNEADKQYHRRVQQIRVNSNPPSAYYNRKYHRRNEYTPYEQNISRDNEQGQFRYQQQQPFRPSYPSYAMPDTRYPPPSVGCRVMYDFDQDLANDINKPAPETTDYTLSKCLSVKIIACGAEVSSLIDTGSQITCISEDFWKVISASHEIDELPVVNVYVVTAIGAKATHIRRQVSLDIRLGNVRCRATFLVVPRLAEQMILGHDWLLKNKVILNYKLREISIEGNTVPRDLVSFHRGSSGRVATVETNNAIYIYVLSTRVDPIKNQKSVYGDHVQMSEKPSNFGDDEPSMIRHAGSKVSTINHEMLNMSKNDENDMLKNDENDMLKNDENDILKNGENDILKNGENDILKNDEIDTLKNDENSTFENSDEISEDSREIDDNIICKLQNIEVDESCQRFQDALRQVARELKGLSSEEINQVIQMLQRYNKLFTDKPEGTTIYTHRLRVINHKPFVKRSYPVPFALREPVSKEIQSMLSAGIIERSESQYCNPLRVVKKKDGSVRLCLDARALNQIIESENETPPLIQELLQKFHGVEVMSSVDLAHGYWQIPLAKESRPYTAFLHDTTLYQFCRVPFGLKTAGSGFICALNLALGHDFDDFLTCYIDDLLVSSKSFEDHLVHLNMIFDRLLQHNFTLRLEKSLFCRQTIPFLGFVISREGIIPDPHKVDRITRFETPKKTKQLQQFLGICNYYRQFSVKYAEYIEPFRELLRKDVVWNWTNDHTMAFENLKRSFVNSVALSHTIPGAIYKLQTDGSDCGISGVLYQTDASNNSYQISLTSRCLTSAEKRYTTTEKELLAIVYSVMKFRVYLLGIKFQIITDHKSLTFLHTSHFHSLRLQRWILLLQQYDFEIIYCRGKDNVVADFFSRNPESQFLEENPDKLLIANLGSWIALPESSANHDILVAIESLKNDTSYPRELKRLAELQKGDEKIQQIVTKLKDGIGQEYHVIYEDILFRKDESNGNWQIVVPTCLTRQIIETEHHKIGHAGVYKSLKHIQNYYYWSHMASEIKKYIVSCDLCQRVKPLNIAMEGRFCRVESNKLCDLVAIDFYGPLPRSSGGVQYILVALDVFLEYVCLYTMRNATTQAALKKMLEKYVPRMGKPKKILSDNGTQFSSPNWRIALEKEGIAVGFSSVRHPQSNPAERVMRELGRLFRTLCSDRHTRWARCITSIETLLNTVVHHSTGYAPCELHFGQKVTDEVQKIVKFPLGIHYSTM